MKYKQYIIYAACLIMSGCANYSSGERTGELIKFSRKGFMFKTWEGTVNLGGGHESKEGIVANTWDFSLDEHHHRGENIEALSDTLQKALDLGLRVKLHYNQEAITNCTCSRGEELYFVDKVTIIYNR